MNCCAESEQLRRMRRGIPVAVSRAGWTVPLSSVRCRWCRPSRHGLYPFRPQPALCLLASTDTWHQCFYCYLPSMVLAPRPNRLAWCGLCGDRCVRAGPILSTLRWGSQSSPRLRRRRPSASRWWASSVISCGFSTSLSTTSLLVRSGPIPGPHGVVFCLRLAPRGRVFLFSCFRERGCGVLFVRALRCGPDVDGRLYARRAWARRAADVLTLFMLFHFLCLVLFMIVLFCRARLPWLLGNRIISRCAASDQPLLFSSCVHSERRCLCDCITQERVRKGSRRDISFACCHSLSYGHRENPASSAPTVQADGSNHTLWTTVSPTMHTHHSEWCEAPAARSLWGSHLTHLPDAWCREQPHNSAAARCSTTHASVMCAAAYLHQLRSPSPPLATHVSFQTGSSPPLLSLSSVGTLLSASGVVTKPPPSSRPAASATASSGAAAADASAACGGAPRTSTPATLYSGSPGLDRRQRTKARSGVPREPGASKMPLIMSDSCALHRCGRAKPLPSPPAPGRGRGTVDAVMDGIKTRGGDASLEGGGGGGSVGGVGGSVVIVGEKRRVGVTAVVRYPVRSGQEIEELAERGWRVGDEKRPQVWRVAKEWSDLRNAHSKSQQFTAAHSTEFKIAVIVLASHRAIQEPSACNFISKHSHSTVTACCNLLWNLLGSDHSLATRHSANERGTAQASKAPMDATTASRQRLARAIWTVADQLPTRIPNPLRTVELFTFLITFLRC